MNLDASFRLVNCRGQNRHQPTVHINRTDAGRRQAQVTSRQHYRQRHEVVVAQNQNSTIPHRSIPAQKARATQGRFGGGMHLIEAPLRGWTVDQQRAERFQQSGWDARALGALRGWLDHRTATEESPPVIGAGCATRRTHDKTSPLQLAAQSGYDR
jgi:hypothetical protein